MIDSDRFVELMIMINMIREKLIINFINYFNKIKNFMIEINIFKIEYILNFCQFWIFIDIDIINYI